MIDRIADVILSKKAHRISFFFWVGPGIALSVFFRDSVLWVAIMSAYANLMLHLIEWHQAKQEDGKED